MLDKQDCEFECFALFHFKSPDFFLKYDHLGMNNIKYIIHNVDLRSVPQNGGVNMLLAPLHLSSKAKIRSFLAHRLVEFGTCELLFRVVGLQQGSSDSLHLCCCNVKIVASFITDSSELFSVDATRAET